MEPLVCPFCDHRNPPQAEFCAQCSAKLDLVPCPDCGAVNKVAAGTCYQCHAALAKPASARRDMPEEPAIPAAPAEPALPEVTLPGTALPPPSLIARASIFERAAAASAGSGAAAIAAAPSVPREKDATVESPATVGGTQPRWRRGIDKAAGVAAVVLVVVIAWFASRGTSPVPTNTSAPPAAATPAAVSPATTGATPAPAPVSAANPAPKDPPVPAKGAAPSASLDTRSSTSGDPPARRTQGSRKAPAEAVPAPSPPAAIPSRTPPAAPAVPKPPRIEACTEAIAALGLCDPAAPRGRP